MPTVWTQCECQQSVSEKCFFFLLLAAKQRSDSVCLLSINTIEIRVECGAARMVDRIQNCSTLYFDYNLPETCCTTSSLDSRHQETFERKCNHSWYVPVDRINYKSKCTKSITKSHRKCQNSLTSMFSFVMQRQCTTAHPHKAQNDVVCFALNYRFCLNCVWCDRKMLPNRVQHRWKWPDKSKMLLKMPNTRPPLECRIEKHPKPVSYRMVFCANRN